MLKKLAKALSMVLGAGIMLTSFTACNTIGPKAVVATVNDEKIYRWELDLYYEENKRYYEENSEEVDDLEKLEFKEQRARYRKDILETLIDDAIVTQLAKKEGYGLTDEEKAKVDQQFNDLRSRNIEEYMKKYPNDSNAEKKAQEDWKKSLEEKYMTEDFLLNNMYDSEIRTKYSQVIFKDVQPSEEEMKELYESVLKEQQEKYTEKPEEYNTDAALPNPTIIYNPEGFVRVKQIMFSLPEEIDEQIKAIAADWGKAIMESDALQQEKGQSDPAVVELQNQMDGYDRKTQELYAEGYAAIQERVDACNAELKAGADFDEMIEKYGDDENMITVPMNTEGYLVGPGSDLVKGFTDAALELENVGDVSEPAQSIQGYHIVKLVKKIPEGPVPFEECQEYIRQLLVGKPQMSTLTELVNKAKMESDANDGTDFVIKRYFDRIG